ncbi:MAG: 2-amino-4-hydroxy-6-hydroxymethyldihydropteridine diphosphokinase [Bacteroidia bacterium]|nr:2-amino-4-hydroxy-6-hydroxymethyldihydropteridine diphosphokinase [Bacteroidia bacterium]
MIFIGVGSNLGDRWKAFSDAWQYLLSVGIEVIQSSPIYETYPWGEREQPLYLNAVWQVTTHLSPEALLETLQAIEQSLGRPPSVRPRWGARIIDLDLLAYGAEIRCTPTLTLPHPWIPHRPFVLGPWNDLAPYFYLPPWKATVNELWQRCHSSGWGHRVPPPQGIPLPMTPSKPTQHAGNPSFPPASEPSKPEIQAKLSLCWKKP